MSEFSEEITRIAQEIGLNVTEVEELVAEATSKHLEVLAEVWERVPEPAKPSIETAMANLMIRHQMRVQVLEQKGAKVPPSPAIPERVRERVEERIREQDQAMPGDAVPPGQGVPGGAGHQNGHGAE
jgi:predicted transcriptional regulator